MHPQQSHEQSSGRARRPSGADRRRLLGQLGEEFAARHFQRLGYTVLARNVRTRRGEIDMIVLDRATSTLVFAEIKTRSAGAGALRAVEGPAIWLRTRQQVRLRRLATAWLSDKRRIPAGAHTLRFDAVGVILDGQNRLMRLDHLEAAW